MPPSPLAPPRGSPHASGPYPRRWVLWPFRLLASTAAIVFFLQAVFAGQFLSGTYGSLQWHQNNAALADMLLMAAIPAAVLLRWPGRGPIWPALAVLGLLVLSYVQSSLGFSRILTVHVPLGVAILMLAAALALWSWRPPRLPGTGSARGRQAWDG